MITRRFGRGRFRWSRLFSRCSARLARHPLRSVASEWFGVGRQHYSALVGLWVRRSLRKPVASVRVVQCGFATSKRRLGECRAGGAERTVCAALGTRSGNVQHCAVLWELSTNAGREITPLPRLLSCPWRFGAGAAQKSGGEPCAPIHEPPCRFLAHRPPSPPSAHV